MVVETTIDSDNMPADPLLKDTRLQVCKNMQVSYSFRTRFDAVNSALKYRVCAAHGIINPLRGNKWLTILLFAVIAVPLILAYRNAPDNDLYFLLANGREILENGFPYVNPWSIYDNQGIVIQQWVPSVINYILYTTYGIGAIALLQFVVASITAFFMWLIGSKVIGLRCDVMALIVFPCVTLMTTYITIRPHVWTMLFFVVTIGILELYRRGASPKILVMLPIIACLHANFHAAMMPFDIAAVIAYALPTNRLPRRLSSRFCLNNFKRYPVIIAAAAMMILACANPYGVDGALYLFLSYGVADYQVYISELHPLTFSEWYSYWFLVCMGIAFISIALMGVRRDFDTQLAAITVVFFVFGCLHVRNIWLVALVVPLLFASSITRLLRDLRIARRKRSSPAWVTGDNNTREHIGKYGQETSSIVLHSNPDLPYITVCRKFPVTTAAQGNTFGDNALGGLENKNKTSDLITDAIIDNTNSGDKNQGTRKQQLIKCLRECYTAFLRDSASKRIIASIGLVAVITVGLSFTYDSEISSHEVGILDNKYTPVEAVEYIKLAAEAIGVDASEFNIFNHFNSGGYLEWCGLSVSMDPRPELWQPAITGLDEEYYFDYVDMAKGHLAVNEYLLDKNFDYLIVDDETKIAEYLEENPAFAEVVLDGNGYKLYRWEISSAPQDIVVQLYIEYNN